MTSQGKQRFPKWWQALILIVAGFVIFFSSCAGAFSGLGGGGSRYPQSLIGAGLLAGAAMFVAGVVLMLVVIIMAIARGFRPVSAVSTPSLSGAGIPQVPILTPQQAEREIIWRLRIAMIVVVAFAFRGIFGVTFLIPRTQGMYSGYLGIVVLSYLLTDAPYVVALIRLARGYDVLGLATAISTPCVNLFFWAWQIVKFMMLSRPVFKFSVYGLYSILGLTPLLDVLVIIFAWQVLRLHPMGEQDRRKAALVSAVVGAYLVVAYVALTHMRPLLTR